MMKLLTLTLALLLMTTTSHAQNVDLEALDALVEKSDASGKEAKPWVDPYSIIDQKLRIKTNDYGITKDDVIAYENSRGEGWFFFIPQTRLSGAERKFIWYMLDGNIYKLNGATDHLTPDIPYLIPRAPTIPDHVQAILKRAGIAKSHQVMEFATSQTFEQHAKKNR